MEQLNRIELRGNIGPSHISQSDGKPSGYLSVATTFLYIDKDGRAVAETDWHNVSINTARRLPRIEDLVVGRPVRVIGKLRHEDVSGRTGYIQAAEVELLDETLSMQTSNI